MPPRVLHIVPHTHWDREWYEPFEVMRYRLVKVVDHVLAVLEEQQAFRHFTLDGQTAAIEDYLEIRPGAEADVAAAVRTDRLSIGPFRVLADGFLCSPETLIRNLQQGAATCRRLGGRLTVGYLPDPFGHPAQMPQLLRLAGLADACVWRGVPRAIDRMLFRWESPDGSWVRAAYLPYGYGHAAALPSTSEALAERARRIAADLEPFAPGEVLLAPNGNDHADVQEDLVASLADGDRDGFAYRIGSLPEAIEALGAEPERRWRGELRSSARANLLPGVLSARLPLKRMAALVAAELERFAEPLTALGGTRPGRMLDRAWGRVVENAGHDSITGCGVDAVARDVETRYTEALRIAEMLTADGLASLAARVDTSALGDADEGVLVFNPGVRERAGAVEVTLTTPVDPRALNFRDPDGRVVPAQPIEVSEQIALDMDVRGSQLLGLVPMVAGRKLADLYVNALRVEPGRPTTIRLQMGMSPEGDFDVEAAKRRVEELATRHPRARFRVLGAGPPLCRLLVATPRIPGLGWSVLTPVAGAADDEVGAGSNELDNGLVRATVGADGTVAVHTASGRRYDGLLAIEDAGDAGDEYTFARPARDLPVTEPEQVVIHDAGSGPVEAALCVERTYRVPAALSEDGASRSRKRVSLPVVTTLALRRGEPFLRVRIEIDNRARDHRVRAMLPMPFPVARSFAEGAFSVDERPPTGEGGPTEAGARTFPSRRWVAVGDGTHGLAVLHRGAPAYEIEDDVLAVTLLRAVGWLSRHGSGERAGPAGPVIATPGAQVPGPNVVELALYPYEGDHLSARVTEAADAFVTGMRSTGVRAHPGPLPPHASALWVEPAPVHLSAVTPLEHGVLVRLWNVSDEATVARVRVGAPLPTAAARVVDLLGEEQSGLAIADGAFELPMRPWEIVTVELGASGG